MLERAERGLAHVLESDKAVLMGWVLELDEMQLDMERKNAPTVEDTLSLQLVKSASILQSIGFFDDRGHLGLTQLLAFKDGSKAATLWNATIDEEVLARERSGELEKWAGRESAALLRARAASGASWPQFDEEGLYVELPLTADGWDLVSRHTSEEDGVEQITLPWIQGESVPKRSVTWVAGLCRVQFGSRRGNHVHFESMLEKPSAFSARLGMRMETSGRVSRTRAQRALALRVVDELEPIR